MRDNHYGRGRAREEGYGRDVGRYRGPVHGPAGPGDGPPRARMRGGYDRGWSDEVAFGREPGVGMGMNGPGMFTPFGWDPMLRWAGWDPLMGFVPYQDAPREWSYGLAEDHRRYDHDFYRGNAGRRPRGGYGRDYDRGYVPQHRLPPGRSPLYGRGGDRALREWARERGYTLDYTIQPRLGPRR